MPACEFSYNFGYESLCPGGSGGSSSSDFFTVAPGSSGTLAWYGVQPTLQSGFTGFWPSHTVVWLYVQAQASGSQGDACHSFKISCKDMPLTTLGINAEPVVVVLSLGQPDAYTVGTFMISSPSAS